MQVMIREHPSRFCAYPFTHQRVVSNIAECVLKNVDGLQSVAGHIAMGLPHPSGSGAPEVISEGMLLRGKNQTEMPLSTHCT